MDCYIVLCYKCCAVFQQIATIKLSFFLLCCDIKCIHRVNLILASLFSCSLSWNIVQDLPQIFQKVSSPSFWSYSYMKQLYFKLSFLEQKLFLFMRILNELCFFISIVHEKPLREVEIAAICHDALQVSMDSTHIEIQDFSMTYSTTEDYCPIAFISMDLLQDCRARHLTLGGKDSFNSALQCI